MSTYSTRQASADELIARARAQVGHIVDKSMRETLIASLADELSAAVTECNDAKTANALLAKENEECMRSMRQCGEERDMWQKVAIQHSKTIDDLNQAAIDAEFGE